MRHRGRAGQSRRRYRRCHSRSYRRQQALPDRHRYRRRCQSRRRWRVGAAWPWSEQGRYRQPLSTDLIAAGDNMLMKDKTVVVVGGSSGIGLATAEMARRDGAHVIVASRNKTRLELAAKKIDAVAIPADVT